MVVYLCCNRSQHTFNGTRLNERWQNVSRWWFLHLIVYQLRCSATIIVSSIQNTRCVMHIVVHISALYSIITLSLRSINFPLIEQLSHLQQVSIGLCCLGRDVSSRSKVKIIKLIYFTSRSVDSLLVARSGSFVVLHHTLQFFWNSEEKKCYKRIPTHFCLFWNSRGKSPISSSFQIYFEHV